MAAASAERHTTRPFAAGAFEFEVATTGADDQRLVEAMFRDLPLPDPPERPLSIFSLLRARGGGRVLDGPHVGNRSSTTLDAALKLLLTAVNLCALDAEPEHLHVHAAAATKAGRAVVVAAHRDVGKTTTVAHLATRGWGFVTDETVRLSVGTDDVTGFPKPLSIKPGGTASVTCLEPWMLPDGGDGPDGFRFVPMGATGAALAQGGAPHLVVLLRRPLDDGALAGPVPQRMHPADAVVGLMQETLDAERFGAAAARLAALAAASHCYELTTGTPEATADVIETLFALDPVDPVDVCVLPPSVAFNPGVVSVAVGDRTVVHDTSSGRIFALDAGGTRVWCRLGGWTVDDGIDVDGPVIAPFVAQLRALGVLVGVA
jgi:hypothetical protein